MFEFERRDVIRDYIEEAHTTALEHGWWNDTPRSVGESIALMHSELSEALEHYRTHGCNDDYKFMYSEKPEGVSIELADVLIRIFDFCGYHKLDLAQALEIKLAYNEKRPFRHGGKLL